MSIKECARLQSLDCLEFLPDTKTAAFRALGNAVNSRVIAQVAEKLINQSVQLNGSRVAETGPPVAVQGA